MMSVGSERRQIGEWQTDVLVIGAGAAGLRAAIAIHEAWQRTIVASLESDRLVLSTEALPEPSPEVGDSIAGSAELAMAGRLLE